MNREISLLKSNRIELPSLTEEAHAELSKGWSFSYVYFFKELRDIFLLIKKFKTVNKSIIYSKCVQENVLPEGNVDWNERNILERINALKNFGLITYEGEIINPYIFNSELGENLTTQDYDVFKSIFFTYFRFREIISWLINPYEKNRIKIMSSITEDYAKNNAQLVFAFISEGRFVNNFIFELINDADTFYIQEKYGDMMRFWDVFVKWGTSLDLIDKFQLKWLDVNILPKAKSFSCLYFKKDISHNFSLMEFIKSYFKSDYIYIPDLILNIVIQYRFSLNDIKELIIKESLRYPNFFSMQRTSEIFLSENEKPLLPIYKNSFISHLLIL